MRYQVKRRRSMRGGVRHKVNTRRSRLAFFIILIVIAAFAIHRVARPAIRSVSRKLKISSMLPKRPEWTKWKLAKVSFSGIPPETIAGVGTVIAVRPGEAIAPDELNRLRGDIAAHYPELRDIRLERRWIGKELAVSAEVRVQLAKLYEEDGTVRGLDTKNGLYRVPDGPPEQGALEVRVAGKFSAEKLGKEIVELIRSITVSAQALPSAPKTLTINLDNGEALMELSDGSLVDWGSADYTQEKLARLPQVFKGAASRLAGPFRVNMRYFEDGRIIMRRLEQSLP